MAANGIRLLVKGRNACFTRPEMKAERVSCDVMIPSAARGTLEAIHRKPAIRWIIDRIHVLRPIRFESVRRNEVGSKFPAAQVTRAMKTNDLGGLTLHVDEDRQQRAMLCLADVEDGIEAHLEMTGKTGPEDNPGKHAGMFRRRASRGQCFHQPCLGAREFPADFTLVDTIPPSEAGDRDLGWMLYDIDYANDRSSILSRARMEGGVIDVAKCHAEARSA